MKKILGLSAITSLAISSSLYANSVSEAFDKLEVNGEIKAGYVDSNFLGGAKSDDVLAIGGSLSAKTGDFYGFKAGATFQAATILSSDTGNNAGTAFASEDNTSYRTQFFDADGSVLSEAFLEYTFSNTSFKAGRQFIHTPLVSNAIEGKSSDAVIKDSFEAYVLTNTDIPDTTIVAGYVDKFQAQSNGTGEIGKFEDVEDGAYTLYLKNDSIKNLTLQAQYLDINGTVSANDKDALFLQADYNLNGHTLSAQYYATTQNDQDAQMFGVRAMGPLGIGKLGYLLGYSNTYGDGAVFTGAGAGATDSVFTALPVHDGEVPSREDTHTAVGAVVIPVAGTTVIAYGGKAMSNTHPIGDVTGMGAMFIYPISKDLQLRANYEHVDVENLITEDTDTTRVYLSFKF